MKKGAKYHVINSLLTSLIRSVRESICPRVFPSSTRSFVAWSVRKPRENNFPYRPHTRLISNQYFVKENDDYFGISGIQSKWFESYLSNRKQPCIVNGQSSFSKTIICEVLQVSIFGYLG